MFSFFSHLRKKSINKAVIKKIICILSLQIPMCCPLPPTKWSRTRTQYRWHCLGTKEERWWLVQRNFTKDRQNWAVSWKFCWKARIAVLLYLILSIEVSEFHIKVNLITCNSFCYSPILIKRREGQSLLLY